MNDEKTIKLSRQFALLQERFIKGLDATLASASELTEKLQESDSWAPESVEELYRLYHNLSGSARSFKVTSIANVAHEASDHLKRVVQDNIEIDLAYKVRLSQLWVKLKTTIDENAMQETVEVDKAFDTFRLRESSGQSVFIVEDDKAQAHQYDLILEEAGYCVTVFSGLDTFKAACQN